MIDHSRHVPLRDVPWDPGAAKAAIAEIAADALAHFGPDPFWPGHPLDDQRRHSGIYYGATGVVWGLEYLRRIGAIDSDFDFKPHLPQLLTNIQADMTAYGDYAAHGSLLAGDMGTALVAMRLAPSAAMAELIRPELETLLEEGGQFAWAAGPLVKGSNLCHGTGGNGYAFLVLHQRTQRTVWLERARAFAMTAIAQCREARHEYGRGRYSLWTGDVGLAIYLGDCLTGRPRFPTVDVF